MKDYQVTFTFASVETLSAVVEAKNAIHAIKVAEDFYRSIAKGYGEESLSDHIEAFAYVESVTVSPWTKPL
jgi:hypothetical protein